jgi:tetratricopeptide (TPR) repeat protein
MINQKKIKLKKKVTRNLIETLDMADEALKGNGSIGDKPEIDIIDQILIVVMIGAYIGLSLMAKPLVSSAMLFMVTSYCGYHALTYVNKVKRRKRQMEKLLEQWVEGYTHADKDESKQEKERLLVGVAIKIYRAIENKLENETAMVKEVVDCLQHIKATLQNFLLGLRFHSIAQNKKKYTGFCSTTFVYGILHEANNALNDKMRTCKAKIIPEWLFSIILAITLISSVIIFSVIHQSDIEYFPGMRKDGIGSVVGIGLIMVIFLWIVPAIRDKRNQKRIAKQDENLFKQQITGYADASEDRRKQLKEEYTEHFYKKIAVVMHSAVETASADEANITKERANYLSIIKSSLEKAIENLQENWEAWEYPKFSTSTEPKRKRKKLPSLFPSKEFIITAVTIIACIASFSFFVLSIAKHNSAFIAAESHNHLGDEYIRSSFQGGSSDDCQAQINAAIVEYSEAIRLKPQTAKYWNNRGDAHRCMIFYLFADSIKAIYQNKALADYDEAIRLKPNNAKLLANKAEIHSRKSTMTRALLEEEETEIQTLDDESAITDTNQEH